MKTIRHLGLGALAALPLLAAACGPEGMAPDAAAPSTGTKEESIIIIPIPDYCKTQAADATLTLGPSDVEVSSTSPNPGYGYRSGCLSWVVDINVPYNSAASLSRYYKSVELYGSSTDSFPTKQYSQSSCESIKVRRTLYKKAAGETEFTQVDYRSYKGTWVTQSSPDDLYTAPYCLLTANQTTPEYGWQSPPSSGTDVYRVAVNAQMDGVYRNVEAGGWHQGILY